MTVRQPPFQQSPHHHAQFAVEVKRTIHSSIIHIQPMIHTPWSAIAKPHNPPSPAYSYTNRQKSSRDFSIKEALPTWRMVVMKTRNIMFEPDRTGTPYRTIPTKKMHAVGVKPAPSFDPCLFFEARSPVEPRTQCKDCKKVAERRDNPRTLSVHLHIAETHKRPRTVDLIRIRPGAVRGIRAGCATTIHILHVRRDTRSSRDRHRLLALR
jgi:hypothetical protein